MSKYKVIDNITGEDIEFNDEYEAESEAERRYNLYLHGYNTKRGYVKPVKNAVLIRRGGIYTICIE